MKKTLTAIAVTIATIGALSIIGDPVVHHGAPPGHVTASIIGDHQR